MKNLIKLIFTIILAAILFTACSTADNPIAPADPGNGGGNLIIKTPVKMRIVKIIVTGFPEKKPNGLPWDYNPIFPLSARPDLAVELSLSGSNSHIFRSKTVQDVDYNYPYTTFTEPASSHDGSLPYNAAMSSNYTIKLLDDDLISDDLMGLVTFTPENCYDNDNATSFSKHFSDGEVGITIEGTWIY